MYVIYKHSKCMYLNDVHKQIVCNLYKVTNDNEGKIKCIVTVNMLL